MTSLSLAVYLSILTVGRLRYLHVERDAERDTGPLAEDPALPGIDGAVNVGKMVRVSGTQSQGNALRLALRKTSAVLFAAVYVGGCGGGAHHFVCARADRTVRKQSAYPLAVDNAQVGKYAPESKSAAGYFYDEVLEYRVWFCPERGAKPVNGKNDYYMAFAEYEKAEELSRASTGAEQPVVLVRQYEWINEPEPGHYQVQKGDRITEWQVEWLDGNKRTPDSISEFLRHRKAVEESKGTVLTKMIPRRRNLAS